MVPRNPSYELPWGNRDLLERWVLGPALSLTLSGVLPPIGSSAICAIGIYWGIYDRAFNRQFLGHPCGGEYWYT